MKKVAFLFPGQGSQRPGMGFDAATRSDAAMALFDRASALLGFDLKHLCFEGPEDSLKATDITQPALYTASAATLEVLRGAGIAPFAVAGHSLGEYSALYAAGVIDFETGLRAVRERGLAMAKAGAERPGKMAAIMGLEGPRVAELCAEVSAAAGAVVVAANFNDPTQTVISGDGPAVEAACEKAKAAGARRALLLPVSGAFHSPLVAPAGDRMREVLADSAFAPPACLFINNADVLPLADADQIRASLVRQITSPVRWVETQHALAAAGTELFIEVGSGKVLQGLAKRTVKDIPCFATDKSADIDEAIAAAIA
jgi:[acyl-carrier-protein] S-malonyltransferase